LNSGGFAFVQVGNGGNKKDPSIGLAGDFWYIFFCEPFFVLLMHHIDHSFSLQCGAGVFAFVPAETLFSLRSLSSGFHYWQGFGPPTHPPAMAGITTAIINRTSMTNTNFEILRICSPPFAPPPKN